MQQQAYSQGGFAVPDIERARDELRNWRAWALDDPNHLGYPSRATFARHYVAGKAFDELPPEQIDAAAAERTEKIVVQVAMTDFDAHRILVAAYLHSKPLKMLAVQFGMNVPDVRALLQRAERVYCALAESMSY